MLEGMPVASHQVLGALADGGNLEVHVVWTAVAEPIGRRKGNSRAFAAIKADGSVVTWGAAATGGDSTSVAEKLAGEVVQICANDNALAALKSDGSVVTWGDAE